MKQRIDIESWARKSQYAHFKNFDEPFYGVCASIDCTKAYQRAKELNASFFLYYLHRSLMASNAVPAFRYRMEGDEVYLYDCNHSAITVDRPDNCFGFGYIDFSNDFEKFQAEGRQEIEKVKEETTLVPSDLGNTIHYSAVPWVNFTSLSHPRRFSGKDSCPKITFGKITEENGKRMIPFAVHVHHALVYGADLGNFIDTFQQLMNE